MDMLEPTNNRREEDSEAPDALLKALAESTKERVFIPPQVDQAVLSQARAHLSLVRQKHLRRQVVVKWTAMAAALILMASLASYLLNLANQPQFARGDINHDGRVDVLDALVLAQGITQRTGSSKQWDINADGVVDLRDADEIAKRAVKLGRGGHS